MTPLAPLAPLVSLEAIDAALVAVRRAYDPRYASRLRRVMRHLLEALRTGEDVESYAQIAHGMWYKVYFLTPVGVLKSDTSGEHLERKVDALRVIRSQHLYRVPLSAVLENWDIAGLWEHFRPLSVLLLKAWSVGAEAYYQQADERRRASPRLPRQQKGSSR